MSSHFRLEMLQPSPLYSPSLKCSSSTSNELIYLCVHACMHVCVCVCVCWADDRCVYVNVYVSNLCIICRQRHDLTSVIFPSLCPLRVVLCKALRTFKYQCHRNNHYYFFIFDSLNFVYTCTSLPVAFTSEHLCNTISMTHTLLTSVKPTKWQMRVNTWITLPLCHTHSWQVWNQIKGSPALLNFWIFVTFLFWHM